MDSVSPSPAPGQFVSQPSQADSAKTEALVQIEHERVLSVWAGLPDRQREILILRCRAPSCCSAPSRRVRVSWLPRRGCA